MTYALALELALPVVDRLLLLQEELDAPLHQLGCDTRWAQGDELRLVLRTFEGMDEALVPRLRQALGVVARAQHAVTFATHGTRLLPTVSQPRMVAVGTLGGADRLDSVRRHIEGACESLGLAPDPRTWAPLVRVGRLRTPGAPVRLHGVVEPYAETAWGETTARELVLIQTAIVRGAAATRVVARLEFGTGR